MGWRLYLQNEKKETVMSFSRNSETYARLMNIPVGWYQQDPQVLNSRDLEVEIQEIDEEIANFKTRIFMEFATDRDVAEFLNSHEYLEELIEARSDLIFLNSMLDEEEDRKYFLWAG
jgi:hypothetical protein